MNKPYDVLEICEFIARSCYAAGEDVDNLRLQKILYFIQLYFYKQYGKPCLTNKIEAWDLGPVVLDAYNHYKKCGNIKIFPSSTYNGKLPSKEDAKSICIVLATLSFYTTSRLIDVSRMHDPWKASYKSYNT